MALSAVQSLITLVIFIVMLGVLVVIHELGHFVTARLAGVRVLEFGLGFPPRAKVLRSHGETLYTLNWLPIGGFVRLEGEDGDSDDERSFVRAPLPTKLVILIAGVVMNLLLAFAIFFAIFAFAYPAWTLTLNEVQVGSPAATAGLVAGDRLVTLDGDRFGGFDNPGVTLRDKAGQTATLGVVHADGRTEDAEASAARPEAITVTSGALGISFGREIAYTQNARRSGPDGGRPDGQGPDPHLERARAAGRIGRQPADPGAARHRPDRHRQPGRRRLLAARAGLHAVPRRDPVGQPRPGQHPPVPATRRWPDGRSSGTAPSGQPGSSGPISSSTSGRRSPGTW
jgi:membrane-associated protease RseP (regulator of RpoE activity)